MRVVEEPMGLTREADIFVGGSRWFCGFRVSTRPGAISSERVFGDLNQV